MRQTAREDVVVVGAGNGEQPLFGGWTCLEEGLTIAVGYDMVELGMNDQGRFVDLFDFVDVAKAFLFPEPDRRR